MSHADRLLRLLTPDRSRWVPMLLGLAASAAVVGVAAALRPPVLIEALMVALAVAAWLVGACAMVGFVRWFFASELQQAMRDRADAAEKEKK